MNHASFFYFFFHGTSGLPRAQSREEKAGEPLIGICGVMFDLSLPSLLEAKSVDPGVSCARQTLVLNTDTPEIFTYIAQEQKGEAEMK